MTMRAFVLTAFALLATATPAGAVQVGIGYADTGPIPSDPARRSVDVIAAPGERNDVTVRASGPVIGADPLDPLPRGARTVTVTDKTASFVATPPSGTGACAILDAHTARCTVAAGAAVEQAYASLGDGNDRLAFAPDSFPLRERLFAGAGNDVFTTGTFDGDNQGWRYASDMGAGDDHVNMGASSSTDGLAVYAGDGDDTVHSLNGATDTVDCGPGNDTLLSDAFDGEQMYSPPQLEPCENRTVPYVGNQ